MPLFRIMGGSRSSSEQNGRPSGTAASSSASSSNSSSRFTYPGHRAITTSSGSVDNSAGRSFSINSHPMVQSRNGPPFSTAGSTTTTLQPPPSLLGAAAPSPQPSMNQSVSSRTHNNPADPPPPTQNIPSSRPPPTAPMDQPPPPANNRPGSRPGAYQVTRTSSGQPAQVYRVTVPQGVSPNTEFTVHAGDRRVRVRCPANSRPGNSLQITLPAEPVNHHLALRQAPLTAAEGDGGGGAVAMTEEVRKVNEEAEASGGTAQTHLVVIPPNVYPGMQFTVNISGQRFAVTCPPNAGPNMKVRIVPPTVREEPEAAPKTQIFEVAVPNNVQPGQPFALIANGQRVLVTCPRNVSPGQKICFKLPVSEVVRNIQLSYESEKGGWCRTIRATDLKFQWVRIEQKTKEIEDDPTADNVNSIDNMGDFDFNKSAYVRKVIFMEGNDARMRTGRIELIPASEAVVDSRLAVHNRTLLSYGDIAAVQGKSLDEKISWFQNICSQLTSPWEDGHIKIVVRRAFLLQDSMDAVMSLGRDDMRKRWRIEFLGEPGIDAGGVAREWFELVSERIFDPDFGLWLSSFNNQACVNINPASAVSCPEDHLAYFRFLGRVIGRALFDRQIIKGHMVRSLYKHILGWPITFSDIEAQDEEYYQSLKKLTTMEDVSLMCLDFTATEDTLGARTEVELVEGGAMKEVTRENLADYLEANLKYRMLGRIKQQATELLLGFFDIIPEAPLTVFDAQELELMLCGLPTIDMQDWKSNTNYTGFFEMKRLSAKQVGWFWDIVEKSFDDEMRARLLQFVTGTSGVPSRGFSVLQGIDGNIKKFTIHGVDSNHYHYPRAHTCFNRIDLPAYDSKKTLEERLRTAITMSGTGFDIE